MAASQATTEVSCTGATEFYAVIKLAWKLLPFVCVELKEISRLTRVSCSFLLPLKL